jgi:hypothetical protein
MVWARVDSRHGSGCSRFPRQLRPGIPTRARDGQYFGASAPSVVRGVPFKDRTPAAEPGPAAAVSVAYPECVARLTGMDMGTNEQAHKEAARRVKVQDGATYTVIKRQRPGPDQDAYYWLGDNGQEIELTEKEIADLL